VIVSEAASGIRGPMSSNSSNPMSSLKQIISKSKDIKQKIKSSISHTAPPGDVCALCDAFNGSSDSSLESRRG
jgi:hypothetical protein